MLAGVCAFFNPCGYKKRIANYDWFRRAITKSGLNLLTVELLFDWQEKSAFSSADVITVRDGDLMWQKERLLQLGINRLLNEADSIVWLDADIIFEQPGWVDAIQRSLDRYDCVQSFESLTSYYTSTARTYPSTVADHSSPAMGGSWAARNDFWQHVSLYQHCVVGGGDHVMSKVFLDFDDEPPDVGTWRYETPTMKQFGPKMRDHVTQWARSVWGDWRVGYVGDQSAYLLSHGREDRRNYNKRHAILKDFDPGHDVTATANGCWRWNGDNQNMRNEVKSYFQDRKEDDL